MFSTQESPSGEKKEKKKNKDYTIFRLYLLMEQMMGLLNANRYISEIAICREPRTPSCRIENPSLRTTFFFLALPFGTIAKITSKK